MLLPAPPPLLLLMPMQVSPFPPFLSRQQVQVSLKEVSGRVREQPRLLWSLSGR